MDPLTLKPIGVVRSPYRTPLDAPRQGEFAAAQADVVLDGRFAGGLEGIEAGERLLIVWWAHEADRATLGRPGSDGVFRMRTPHRPNPVCLSEVEVVQRDGPRLTVRGLEAIDGTPVLDIKSARAEFEGWSALPTRVD